MYSTSKICFYGDLYHFEHAKQLLMLLVTYYALNYAGINGRGLLPPPKTFPLTLEYCSSPWARFVVLFMQECK